MTYGWKSVPLGYAGEVMCICVNGSEWVDVWSCGKGDGGDVIGAGVWVTLGIQILAGMHGCVCGCMYGVDMYTYVWVFMSMGMCVLAWVCVYLGLWI